ncbi:uncharacterized protein N7459_005230 [Penicillium hispanicum]|uniref:uncharacterized protein n=1 Tax=Penicillium hispanicum TaxID=1080232 RepID=UPI0025411540|nr:uncharacterized protein N7459_005230 [Penicillium hispanicum]KAJ5585430.1 hypothetical protein N7459_005230 [Penicillium hispanicum]
MRIAKKLSSICDVIHVGSTVLTICNYKSLVYGMESPGGIPLPCANSEAEPHSLLVFPTLLQFAPLDSVASLPQAETDKS